MFSETAEWGKGASFFFVNLDRCTNSKRILLKSTF